MWNMVCILPPTDPERTKLLKATLFAFTDNFLSKKNRSDIKILLTAFFPGREAPRDCKGDLFRYILTGYEKATHSTEVDRSSDERGCASFAGSEQAPAQLFPEGSSHLKATRQLLEVK